MGNKNFILNSVGDIPESYDRFKLLDQREVSSHWNLRKKITKKNLSQKTISIITPTNKLNYMQNIFDNYKRQAYPQKELIVILNNNDLVLNQWRKYSRDYVNVQVYQLDESITLGECLNFALDKANGEYISKFDDDDYYAPKFLMDLIGCFYYTDAAIVGKKSQFVYFESLGQLYLVDSGKGYSYRLVSGGTQVIKRKVFDEISFNPRNRGEDDDFNDESFKKGFKHFAADPFNYVRVRRANKKYHTWKIEDSDYRTWGKLILETDHPESYVSI